MLLLLSIHLQHSTRKARPGQRPRRGDDVRIGEIFEQDTPWYADPQRLRQREGAGFAHRDGESILRRQCDCDLLLDLGPTPAQCFDGAVVRDQQYTGRVLVDELEQPVDELVRIRYVVREDAGCSTPSRLERGDIAHRVVGTHRHTRPPERPNGDEALSLCCVENSSFNPDLRHRSRLPSVRRR